MSEVKIELPNLKKIQEIWKKAPEKSEATTKKLLTQITSRLEGESIKEIRKGRFKATDTGSLGQSIFAEIRGGGFTGRIASGVKHANYVHEGTGVYGPKRQPIKPKRSKMLVWKKNGQLIFARETKGMKARPFFKQAVKISEAWIKKRVKTTYEKLIESV